VAVTTRGRNRTMTVVTLVIVALSAVAFVRTQALKQEEPPIGGIDVGGRVVPGCDCPLEAAQLSFRLRRSQPIEAVVVDDEERPVRTLLRSTPRTGETVRLDWDGTDDAGRPAAPGEYRLLIDLATPDRDVVLPEEITVEAAERSDGA
jgi:hypothetical protein